MFISIKKHLLNRGVEEPIVEALTRMNHLLLQGVALHAVVGDPDEFAKFREDMKKLQEELETETTPAEMLVTVGTALRALEEYNSRTTKFLKAQSVELHLMVSMLAKTVTDVSTGSERTINRLQGIEKQIEKVAVIEDIRNLKSRLSDCLESLREETQQHRVEAAEAVTALDNQAKTAAAMITTVRSTVCSADPLTGLPGRAEAEKRLASLLASKSQSYVAILVLDRLEVINARFGFAAGDQLLLEFSQHLAQNLASSTSLYRWSPACFLSLIVSSMSAEDVRKDVQRVASFRLEKLLQIGGRSVLLPISCHFTVMTILESPGPEALYQKVESFISR